MLLRIDTFEVNGTTVIQVIGQLVDEGVAEFETMLQNVKAPWTVDVSLLRTADAKGIKTLRSIVEAGGELRNVSPYIQLLMNRET